MAVYYDRCRRGEWIGEWAMPRGKHQKIERLSKKLRPADLENLLSLMLNPDPHYRITAMQAYHHRALQPAAPSVVITPHFVRTALDFDDEEPIAAMPNNVRENKEAEKKSRRNKKKDAENVRANTPTALGESIKQHHLLPSPRLRRLVVNLGCLAPERSLRTVMMRTPWVPRMRGKNPLVRAMAIWLE